MAVVERKNAGFWASPGSPFFRGTTSALCFQAISKLLESKFRHHEWWTMVDALMAPAAGAVGIWFAYMGGE